MARALASIQPWRSAAEGELLLPDGPRDLAALLARRHDRRALEALANTDPAALKVRERIRFGVLARLEGAMQDEAAVRRWAGFLALPAPLRRAIRAGRADCFECYLGASSRSTRH